MVQQNGPHSPLSVGYFQPNQIPIPRRYSTILAVLHVKSHFVFVLRCCMLWLHTAQTNSALCVCCFVFLTWRLCHRSTKTHHLNRRCDVCVLHSMDLWLHRSIGCVRLHVDYVHKLWIHISYEVSICLCYKLNAHCAFGFYLIWFYYLLFNV